MPLFTNKVAKWREYSGISKTIDKNKWKWDLKGKISIKAEFELYLYSWFITF